MSGKIWKRQQNASHGLALHGFFQFSPEAGNSSGTHWIQHIWVIVLTFPNLKVGVCVCVLTDCHKTFLQISQYASAVHVCSSDNSLQFDKFDGHQFRTDDGRILAM